LMTLRLKSILVFASLVLLTLGLFVLVPKTQALIVPGGPAGGCSGGCDYYTTNGFGWYSYDVNGSGPEAWAIGGPWNTVRNQCIAEGAGRFDAFIVQRAGGNNSGNNAKVYLWEAGGYSTNWPGYKGNNGGNWLSLSTAQSHFNTIPNKGGYVFGVNVAGFCYQDTRYDLTPSLTSNLTGGEAGEPVNVTPRVNNAGPTASYTTYWTISSMTYPSGSNPPTTAVAGSNGGVAAVDTAKPCQYYTGTGASNCQFLSGSSGTGKFAVGSPSSFTYATGTTWGTTRFILGNYPVGTKVCYGLSVYSRNQQTGTSQTWAHSAPVCMVISRKPKVQVHGGDVIVGRSFVGGGTASSADVNTSQTVKYR
jgi:hypothetical protein